MTIPDKNDETSDADRPLRERRTPGSGHGADSALTALIKRRLPPPEPPPEREDIPPA